MIINLLAMGKFEKENLPVIDIKQTVCKTCNGKKKVQKFDLYDGKLIGSIKCWECNDGIRPSTMFDNY